MNAIETYKSLLQNIQPLYSSVEEAKIALNDFTGDFVRFVVFVPGEYQLYRFSRDRTGCLVVNRDIAITIYALETAKKKSIYELGQNELNRLIPNL